MNRRIGFRAIFDTVEETVSTLRASAKRAHTLTEIFDFDTAARELARELIERNG